MSTDNYNVPFKLAENVEYSDGAIVSKTLSDKKAGTITVFAFDKGQGLSEHVAPFDAAVQVLDGAAKITIGGKEFEVAAGEMIIMPADISHALQAETRFKMLLIMIRG